MTKPVKILYLEDNPMDADLVRISLQKYSKDYQLTIASNSDEFQDLLDHRSYDLVLSDNNVLGFDSLMALDLVRKKQSDLPFIVLSGSIGDKETAKYKEHGISMMIEKSELPKLGRLIHQSLIHSETPSAINYDAFNLLISAIQELSLCKDLQSIINIVKRTARLLTGSDGATFVLRENEFCYYADEDAIAPLWKGRRFPLQSCISGWAMEHRQYVIIEDIYKDPRIPKDAYQPTFVTSLLMVPIRTASPIGAIGNYWAKQHTATAEEIKLLQALADSTSVAMENVSIYQNLEERVRDRTAQLELAYQELDSFTASVSHDLRAPLTAIRGFTSMLQEDSIVSPNPRQQDIVLKILRSTDRMNQLIESLLSLSRYSQTPLTRQKVDLSAIASEVANLCVSASHALQQRKICWRMTEGIETNVDPTLIRVVFQNLFSNAIKYSSQRPEICIEFGTVKNDQQRIFFVKDNGVGFDMKLATRIFEPFQRFHSEKEFPGIGIGLATVQRIIKRHGGKVWAESKPREGTTFYFTLPD